MSDEAPLLDHAVIDELRDSVGGDTAFVTELIETYLAEAPGQIDEIVAAASSGDCDAIVRPAHTLKSSSASLGAARLAQIAREIELAGREGRSEGLAQTADSARSTYEATVEAITAAGLRL
ncbi:MAG TPA: Hpt domain-containing protein [Candidatus Limnocylindrales bacterium]|nr:Hpt domain-containing protein [Candidatus Limnocylindrales bacterium]